MRNLLVKVYTNQYQNSVLSRCKRENKESSCQNCGKQRSEIKLQNYALKLNWLLKKIRWHAISPHFQLQKKKIAQNVALFIKVYLI